MHAILELTNQPHLHELHQMLAYHLGWEAGQKKTSGKRIRPLLTLLSTEAAGADWQAALPAAAAIELIHNFSLIHDDIEDHSSTRRGKPTLWVKWGIPQAINTGDALFTLAHLAALRLENTFPAASTLQVVLILQNTCLSLTQGQHLDMAYETQAHITLDEYWRMISGKTAALFTACTHTAAILGATEQTRCASFCRFGENLGLAFQVLDDLLGIWGDPQITGKSVASDLLEGKKTLPVLYGLSLNQEFSHRWLKGAILPADVQAMADLLESEGGRDYTRQTARRLTHQALQALDEASLPGQASQALKELTHSLLLRNM